MSEPPARGGGEPLPTVTARGDALVRTEPDEAILWLTLSALEPQPSAALADVATRSRALTVLLDDLGVEPADRSTSGISVQEEFEHTPDGRRSLGHRARTVTALRLTDPRLIGELISKATEETAAHVAGPQWQIALDNPARLAAARGAAADAQRKAQAYAEGVGAELGRLLEISEPDNPGFVMRASARAQAASAGEPIAVEPGEQAVTASVRVTFAVELRDPAS